MLPKWFDDWNEKNPKDVFGPGILVGVLGGAVFVAAMLVAWGRPLPVEALQTGPRGTGMSVTDFVSESVAGDPSLAGYVSADPVIPQAGDQTASDAYDNVDPLLGDLSAANYDRLVTAMRAWTGIPTLLNGEDNYQNAVAYIMIQMTQNLNENWSGHVNLNGEAGVNCYTCHRGQPVPSDIWFRVTPVNQSTAGWASVQNRTTPLSSYTSLPSDALMQYLVEAEQIVVHDLDPRVPGLASDEGYRTWQDTERTYSLMNYFSNSLGVNCVFCHNSRAFYDVGQVTPQWATAQLAIGMVQELNTDWLVRAGELLPPERLGVRFGDAPKAACRTCHKGYQRPMGGADMISDWPELATTGEVVYQ